MTEQIRDVLGGRRRQSQRRRRRWRRRWRRHHRRRRCWRQRPEPAQAHVQEKQQAAPSLAQSNLAEFFGAQPRVAGAGQASPELSLASKAGLAAGPVGVATELGPAARAGAAVDAPAAVSASRPGSFLKRRRSSVPEVELLPVGSAVAAPAKRRRRGCKRALP